MRTETRIPPAVDAMTMADSRITYEVVKQLRHSSHFELRSLNCQHCEGVLVLRGRVSSFYLKQLAQEHARMVSGVSVIMNQLEVGR